MYIGESNMSELPETIPTYASVMDDWMKEQLEQEKKDAEVLETIKQQVSAEQFENIKAELEEDENTSNYRIVYEPIGTPQHESDGDYTIWINQSCGETGDDYSGTVCMKLKDGKYFMWDYWM